MLSNEHGSHYNFTRSLANREMYINNTRSALTVKSVFGACVWMELVCGWSLCVDGACVWMEPTCVESTCVEPTHEAYVKMMCMEPPSGACM